MKTIRIGIVGGGIIAKTHLECMRRVYGVDVQVVGVTDVVAETGGKYAEKHGIRFFGTLEEMLPYVDAIDVCTPPFAHADVIAGAARAGKAVSCEKPLIGYAPDAAGADAFHGLSAPKQPMLEDVAEKVRELRRVLQENDTKFAYFENFAYTPHVAKEAEIIKKTNAQILRMTAEEAHFGNPARYSAYWKYACGGSLISTGSHPIGGILYLKRVEGIARGTGPIRPKTVSARIHALTGLEGYDDQGFLRNDYYDVEDYGWAHIVFEDGTVGDIIAGATVLGGVNDYIDVFANNHRSRLNINLSGVMETYNPGTHSFEDIYVNDCISHQSGWLKLAVDSNWMFGYQAEMQDAMQSFAAGGAPQSGIELAADVTMTIYSAYLSAEKRGAEVDIIQI